VRFGVTLVPDDTRALGPLTRVMEETGYDLLGAKPHDGAFSKLLLYLGNC